MTAPSAGLGANHVRVLAAGLLDIEGRLADSETLLARDDVIDLTEAQRRLLLDHFRLVRRRLDDGLASLGLRRGPRPSTRARASVSTMLTFLGIALDDMGPKTLRGYGALDDGTAARLTALLADVARVVVTAQAVLSDAGADLDARVARLDSGLVDARAVSAVARAITRHGLVELRRPLAALAELLETSTLEIAVFGRVSTGKSSLLNAVLEQPVLPIGALPVTALPTRVTKGERGLVRVEIEGRGEAEEHALERLSDYVTEEKNPGNRRRVARVTVFVPSPHLRAGVALVDTPGISSLAASGTRETYAYLPRCDQAIVTVAAGGALEQDDLALVARLRDSGIPVMLVVTKSDLLEEDDRRRFCDHVRAAVRDAAGVELPIHAVSAVGDGAALARAWFAREIEPLFDRVRDERQLSARRKLAALRRATIESLRSASVGPSPPSAEARRAQSELDIVAGRIELALEKASVRCHDLAGGAPDLARWVIRLAVHHLVASDAVTPADALREALRFTADEVTERISEELVGARDRVREHLRRAAVLGAVDVRVEDVGLDLLTMPTLEMPELGDIRMGTFARKAPGRRARVERALADGVGSVVARALFDFTGALRAFARGATERLADQAAAQLDPARAALGGGGDASLRPAEVAEDLRTLECEL